MGVPGFFAWLIKKYNRKDFVLECLPDDVRIDDFYVDANCLVHPQCFNLLAYYPDWKDINKLHNMMIKRIINYLNFLKEMCNPRRKMVVSIDGVAPLAKMNQQRLRRFMALRNLERSENIKRKHGRTVPNRWSNIEITPATEFMEKLHNALISWMKSEENIEIVYSSYHTPGEGEHKIMEDIRKETDDTKVKAVYGLDADLIFLSWACRRKNMYLVREASQFDSRNKKDTSYLDPIEDVEEDLNFVTIDGMKNKFVEYIQNLIKKKDNSIELDFENTCSDIIFLCYFLGNDFLPHFPSIDVNISGLDILISAYVDTYVMLQSSLIEIDESIEINNIFLASFLNYMGQREEYYFKKIFPDFIARWENRKCHDTDPYSIEMWKIENMLTDEDIKYRKNDPIGLGKGPTDAWKHRYYEHHFNVKGNQKDFVNKICEEYYRGLLWVANYYFKGCPSWTWQFPYQHTPFVSDLAKYVDSIDSFKPVFEDHGCLLPCQQLLAVLPPECSYVMPKSYQNLTKGNSEIIDFFPTDIEQDRLYKYKDFQCSPKIPQVDPLRIKKATKKLKLTNNESIRNRVLGEFSNRNK